MRSHPLLLCYLLNIFGIFLGVLSLEDFVYDYCDEDELLFQPISRREIPKPKQLSSPSCSGLTLNTFYLCPHSSIRLPLSRLNDTVCDCCDGSDETERRKCPDNCEEISRRVYDKRKGMVNRYTRGKEKKDKAVREYREKRVMEEQKYDSDAMKLINLQDEVRKLKETVDLEQKIIDDERAKRYKEAVESAADKLFSKDSVFFENIELSAVDLNQVLRYLNFLCPASLKATFDSLQIPQPPSPDPPLSHDFSKLLQYFETASLSHPPNSPITNRKKRELTTQISNYNLIPPLPPSLLKSVIASYLTSSKISSVDFQLSLLHSLNPHDSFYIDCSSYLPRNSFKISDEVTLPLRCSSIKDSEIQSRNVKDVNKQNNYNGFGALYNFTPKQAKDIIDSYTSSIDEANRLSILNSSPVTVPSLKASKKSLNDLEVSIKKFEADSVLLNSDASIVVLKDVVINFKDSRYEYYLDVLGKITQKGDRETTLGHYHTNWRDDYGRLIIDYTRGE
ncbi:hypothetical protein TrVE_jg1097 [Triparma verrucosa]|uniref:Glucosidase II beta subunit N-terminal domain-containing protein n=1 Tax=Triparma verrucosa TaxID=1606542 RepID=A0A9W7CH59_9STRA|nr:hypothetical protein TrVE_jg1097 [Triparma verrucosa]